MIGTVPRHHGPNVRCLAALTPTGITAPLAIAGAVESAVFVPWLRDWLLHLARGTTLVCDNLSVHTHADVRPAVEAAGCRLPYLPPSSRDFNPIELAFSTLKTHLRGVAARSFEPLRAAIGTGLDRITAADIRSYDAHCGFPLPDPTEQPS